MYLLFFLNLLITLNERYNLQQLRESPCIVFLAMLIPVFRRCFTSLFRKRGIPIVRFSLFAIACKTFKTRRCYFERKGETSLIKNETRMQIAFELIQLKIGR